MTGPETVAYRLFVLVHIVLASLLLAQAPTSDVSSEQARQHIVGGNRAFDLGRYDDAIAEFQKAYLIKDVPALLYNIAQAYRLSARPEEAMRFYQKYLTKSPNASNREDVEQKIATLRKIAEAQKQSLEAQKQSLNDKPNEPIAAHASLSKVEQAAPPPKEWLPAPATGPFSSWTRKTTSLVVGGGGLVAMAAAGVFALKAHSASNQMTAAAARGLSYDPSLDASGRTSQTVSRVLAGAGVLALGAGATLFFLSRGPLAVQASPAGASAKVAF